MCIAYTNGVTCIAERTRTFIKHSKSKTLTYDDVYDFRVHQIHETRHHNYNNNNNHHHHVLCVTISWPLPKRVLLRGHFVLPFSVSSKPIFSFP